MSDFNIKGTIYHAVERELPLDKVKFWEENPRLYEILNIYGQPTQAEIQDKLSSMEHVKKLRIAIEASGLIEPILVRDGDFIVIEGNSRLSAYKLLYEKEPLKWNKIRCEVLPERITPNDILTLLGQYHLIGRTNWGNFAQAGFLYRALKESNKQIDTLAMELGVPITDAKKLVKIYKYMREVDDLRPDAWSYYDVLLSNQGLKKYRDTTEELDNVIVSQIKSGKIKKARDLQDKLGIIAKGTDKDSKKIISRIIKEEITIDEGFELYQETGKDKTSFQAIQRFRKRIYDEDFQRNLQYSNENAVYLELKKINNVVSKLMKQYEKEQNKR